MQSTLSDNFLQWRGKPLRWALAQRQLPPRAAFDARARLGEALAGAPLLERIGEGQRVALALGSRGITDGVAIAGELVRLLQDRGALVEAIPAMGSHGGATSAGQVETLRKLGFAALGIPIVGWDETTTIGETSDGRPIVLSSHALDAVDWLIPINRIKQHTSFRGALESGLCKITAIGLGGRPGASAAHQLGPDGIARYVEEGAELAFSRLRVPFALGIIEGPSGETADVVALEPDGLIEHEKRCLDRARQLHPALPFDDLDVLLVDEMGKDISGTGLDTHVIGRWGIGGLPPMERPRIARIGVLSLSPASRGNANGIGMVDAVSDRLVEAIDYADLRVNTLATTFLERGRTPLRFPTDGAVIEACLVGARIPPEREPRLLRVRSTKHLDRFYVSEGLASEVQRAGLALVEPFAAIRMREDGRLVSTFDDQERRR